MTWLTVRTRFEYQDIYGRGSIHGPVFGDQYDIYKLVFGRVSTTLGQQANKPEQTMTSDVPEIGQPIDALELSDILSTDKYHDDLPVEAIADQNATPDEDMYQGQTQTVGELSLPESPTTPLLPITPPAKIGKRKREMEPQPSEKPSSITVVSEPWPKTVMSNAMRLDCASNVSTQTHVIVLLLEQKLLVICRRTQITKLLKECSHDVYFIESRAVVKPGQQIYVLKVSKNTVIPGEDVVLLVIPPRVKASQAVEWLPKDHEQRWKEIVDMSYRRGSYGDHPHRYIFDLDDATTSSRNTWILAIYHRVSYPLRFYICCLFAKAPRHHTVALAEWVVITQMLIMA